MFYMHKIDSDEEMNLRVIEHPKENGFSKKSKK